MSQKAHVEPHIALFTLLDQRDAGIHTLRPEHVLSLANQVIMRIDELTWDNKERFIGYITHEYPELRTYAESSEVPLVKHVAFQCAKLVGDTNTVLEKYANRYARGEQFVIFECLDYLRDQHEDDRARSLLQWTWEEREKQIQIQIDLHIQAQEISNKNFLTRLANYAYSFMMDDTGYRIANILEWWKILKDDIILLKYKQYLSDPREFFLVSEELRNFYISGNTHVLTDDLIGTFWVSIDTCITLMDSTDDMSDDMRSYLQSLIDQKRLNIDLASYDGKCFFFLFCVLARSLFYEDALRAEFLLSFIEKADKSKLHILAMVIRFFPLSCNDGDDSMTDHEIIIEEILMNLLYMFWWSEYDELKSKIFHLLKRLSPIQSQGLIQELKTDRSNTWYYLSHESDEWNRLYFSLFDEAHKKLPSLVRYHIRNQVLRWERLAFPSNATTVVYFLMEWKMTYGTLPKVSDEFFTNMNKYYKLTSLEDTFFRTYYPHQFLQIPRTSWQK